MMNLKEFVKTKMVKRLPYVGRAFAERDDLRRERNALVLKRVLSQTDLSKVNIPGKYDLVWCGSLVTHFNDKKSMQLLDLLASCLAPEGLLGFTTQGRIWAEYIQQNVFRFLPDDDFARLRDQFRKDKTYAYINYQGMSDFGMSLTTPGWIYNYLYDRFDLTLVSFCEKAWHGTQDVTFCQKKPLESWHDWHEV